MAKTTLMHKAILSRDGNDTIKVRLPVNAIYDDIIRLGQQDVTVDEISLTLPRFVCEVFSIPVRFEFDSEDDESCNQDDNVFDRV